MERSIFEADKKQIQDFWDKEVHGNKPLYDYRTSVF